MGWALLRIRKIVFATLGLFAFTAFTAFAATGADSTQVKKETPTVTTALPSVADTTKQAAKAASSTVSVPAPAPLAPAPQKVVMVDSVKVDSTNTNSTKTDSTKPEPQKKRKRIVRETNINTIDELKGQYRSPKKALFMSLLVPGLGQAYVGQHWVNYTRAAVYLMTDVALAFGWHYYVVERQNETITAYRKYADQNWSQARYEKGLLELHTQPYTKDNFDLINPERKSYCDAVQNKDASRGNLYAGCLVGPDPDPTKATQYSNFKDIYDDSKWSTDSITNRRAQFVDPHTFYELLGKEVEFIRGWNDATNIGQSDSTFYLTDKAGKQVLGDDGKALPATTANQQAYIDMRAQANDYARMQAYFLGGMIVNHLISALDAAITAHYHNKALYQTDVMWWDRVHLDGGLAWQGYQPTTSVTARVSF